MTIKEAAIQHNVCLNCGVGEAAHWKGVIDGFGQVHYADRRFSRRALRNLLLLVARSIREADKFYLNTAEYDWLYLYIDNVEASRMALELGTRLPARLSRLDRLRCLSIAKARGIRLSRRSAVYAWAHDG